MNRKFGKITALLALFVWPLAMCLLFALPASAQTAMTATAQLIGKDGKSVGTATFTETGAGVRVQVQVNGIANLEGAGEHGIHIHQTASCVEPDFESAGEHFNPLAKGHGMNNPDGDHAGDLPNISLDAAGVGTYDQTSNMFTLSPGELSIFDTDGSALVIHMNPDDYMTDPSGKSGARVACGVIVQSNGGLVGMPRTGAADQNNLLWPVAFGALLFAFGAGLVVRSRKLQA